MKVIWIDTETTGLNAFSNGVIQIASIIVIDDQIKETANLHIAPFQTDMVDSKALKVVGVTQAEILGYTAPKLAYTEFVKMLGRYVDKYNKHDKFILAGYNVGFDADALRMWFKKNGDNYFYSYVFGGKLDVIALVMAYCEQNNIFLPNHKLETVAHHFGITAKFHDALDDIKVTKAIYDKIKGIANAHKN